MIAHFTICGWQNIFQDWNKSEEITWLGCSCQIWDEWRPRIGSNTLALVQLPKLPALGHNQANKNWTLTLYWSEIWVLKLSLHLATISHSLQFKEINWHDCFTVWSFCWCLSVQQMAPNLHSNWWRDFSHKGTSRISGVSSIGSRDAADDDVTAAERIKWRGTGSESESKQTWTAARLLR